MEKIFDSHAHYDDERFDNDRETLLNELFGNTVCGIINIGCDKNSSQKSILLAKQFDKVYAAVGYHPHEAQNAYDGYLDDLEAFSKEEKVVAIGEIGLDYHYDLSPRETQKRVFEEQLALASKLSLPVIIHAREATEDYLSLLKKHKPQGVVHCFSGSAQTARQVLELDMYIGFTGVVTFKNARKTLEAVAEVPLDRLLLETDCPYMAPEPFRGKRCSSDMIKYTAQAIADVKGIDIDAVIRICAENTRRLFSIKKD